MQNRLTIKDISRLSGVGKSTVSRVLTNETDVTPRTAERGDAVLKPPRSSPIPLLRAFLWQSVK
ncbi:LacI family DNA-binding transcriptional regulator, partial [Escherichia coli]|uniref:LacI family DNA-binding transcriptional regulator n=1 Tax=Escherichia coli TaxID=562 RepID=UPI001C706FB7